MSLFKCKMCGGELEFNPGDTIGVCDSCGSKQTLPRLDDDRRANLYDRANHLRRNNEFDKAEGIYEQILAEDTSDAEAYWSLVLCRYGIEYVEDPATRKRVPTVNRAQYKSIFDDDNYKSALQYADGYQRTIYEEEANVINEIQKGILDISNKEEPFDVFICYKETDSSGRRTQDSVLAYDLYKQLTNEGLKVFFSRVTLEDKLGTAYEPYIFAALNSAKVMVVIGTKPEHFNAVWVKNEWRRYLSLVEQSGGKKVLIPAYRDMDPYDMPEEFSHLQAQDMSKLGFMQDLTRGIKKIIDADESRQAVKETVVISGNANADPLLERAFLFLEDGKWQDANLYCEKVLDIDPKNAEAYLGKLMAELGVRKRTQLADCATAFDNSENFGKVIRFGDKKLGDEMRGYITHIIERNENARLMGIYNNAISNMNSAKTEAEFKAAASSFKMIPGFKDADALAEQCLYNAEESRKNAIYLSAKKKMAENTVSGYEEAISIFRTIPGWKDADEKIYTCERRINEINEKAEANRLELERKDQEKRKEAKKTAMKRVKTATIITLSVVVFIGMITIFKTVIKPKLDKYAEYKAAVELYDSGKYHDAVSAFTLLNGYKDSDEWLEKCRIAISDEYYEIAVDYYIAGDYQAAYNLFKALNYKNSSERATECLLLKQKAGLAYASVGSTIKYGLYEQDNNTGTGKEEIEWLVLAVEDNKALVISKYALDCQNFNSTDTDTTWEECSLREWLNESFYKEAFLSEQQDIIATTIVTADANPMYDTNPGNDTTDKIFLLSYTETEKYFENDEARMCFATDYAIAQGSYTMHIDKSDKYCAWWLRTPGEYSYYATLIRYDGSFFEKGSDVYYEYPCSVRPAMWIELQ